MGSATQQRAELHISTHLYIDDHENYFCRTHFGARGENSALLKSVSALKMARVETPQSIRSFISSRSIWISKAEPFPENT
jgi:hypothetical protein